jgi:hypothetical protein
MKKLFTSAVVILFTALSLACILPASTVIADCVNGIDEATGQKCTPSQQTGQPSINQDAERNCKEATSADFLNFPRWSRGLDCDNDGHIKINGGEPGTIIFTIALNVIDIALRLAGIIAVGLVIWGGFHYTMSHGEPEQAKKSMNIIRSALIGLVISMIAAVVVSFIVWRLSQ